MADLMIQKLRNNEYFGMQDKLDELYEESQDGRYFEKGILIVRGLKAMVYWSTLSKQFDTILEVKENPSLPFLTLMTANPFINK